VGIAPGGPAALAGLVAADPQTGRGGDLIVDIDGRRIDDFADLNGYLICHTRVGQTIQIAALRQGECVVVSLRLGERP
jgi:S1-C subfamily serine protease